MPKPDLQRPYNRLPRLTELPQVETVGLLRQCIKAHTSLAELKGAEQTIPNPSVLVDTLALQEARASSEIENVVTTNAALYRVFATRDERADPATKEVLRYHPAIFSGMDMLRRKPFFDTDMLVKICSALLGGIEDVRSDAVVLRNIATDDVVYTPPSKREVITELLDDFQRFIDDQNPEPDPLIRMAIGHYQFEAIHPFPDGNGRTGRVVNILYLIRQGLLNQPVMYLSRFFLRNRQAYYEKLLAVTTDGAWEDWIAFFLQGIHEMADETRLKIAEIQSLRAKFGEDARAQVPRASSEPLLDLLFERPYCTIDMVQKVENSSRLTASTHLYDLENIGLLQSMKRGRNRLFVNDQLIQILEH